MKKIKIVVSVVILGFIALVAYQNSGFVFVKHHFGINLLIFNYQTPEIPNFVLLLVFFLAGLLLAYFASLAGRFKSKKVIRELTGQVDSCREKTAALERQMAALKTGSQGVEAVGGDSAVLP